jgi:N-glycosidase YbiA
MSIIEFSSKIKAYGEFSNFWPAEFVLDGRKWPTVEHYFQAQKFSQASGIPELIRLAASAVVAKRMGRIRSPHFREDWNTARDDVMLAGLRAKFAQNAELAELLVQTGTAELKEKAYWDSYWGTGRNGQGQNRMGILLSQVRSELTQ